VSYNPDLLYFCSDTHFGHSAVLGYGRRPFGSVEEMNAQMVAEWNQVVPREATVIHLGDVSFMGTAKTVELLNQLNGNIELVEGNHDSHMTGVVKARFKRVDKLRTVKVGSTRIVCCHFPLESWDRMAYGAWHLHGHTHGSMPSFGRRLDVGGDALRFWHPISFRAIEARMNKTQPSSRDCHQPKLDIAQKVE